MKLQSYWSAVSQIIPILGLALIVEARQVWKRRDEYRPDAKVAIVIIYGLPLLAFVFIEIVVLNALRGLPTWSGWPIVINNVISAALTALLLAPAVAYFSIASRRMLMRQYFRTLFFQLRLKNRVRVHQMRRAVRELQQSSRMFDDKIAMLDEVERSNGADVEDLHKAKRELLALKSKAQEAERLMMTLIKRIDGRPKFPLLKDEKSGNGKSSTSDLVQRADS